MGVDTQGTRGSFHGWTRQIPSLLALPASPSPSSLPSFPLPPPQPKNYKGVRYHKERHQWQAYILDDDQVRNV